MSPERGGPHPQQDQLERFMRGELPRSEAPAIVRHLLTSCPQCLKVTRAAVRQILLEEEVGQGGLAIPGRLRLLKFYGR